MQKQTNPVFAVGDMSFSERRQHLQEALDAWTAEQREESDYWYPRRYIVDVYDDYLVFEEYTDSGTVCCRVSYTVGSDYMVTFGSPERVIRTSNYEPAPAEIVDGPPAEMSAEESVPNTGIAYAPTFYLKGRAKMSNDGLVIRTGKVSEAGQYPDKNIAFDPSDFDAAASVFAPVPLNNEHKPSLMDGSLGTLQKVWRDGSSLFGEVAVPKWLDDVFTQNGVARTVSLEWDRAKKTVVGCAWAKHPRISDAILMSAFSASKETQAEPAATEPTAPSTNPAPAPETTTRAVPGKGKPLMLFTAAEKKVADLLKKQGHSDEEINAQIAVIFADDRETSITTEAATFADSMIRSEKAKPHARAIITSLFAQALRDDWANSGTVTFSKEEGKQDSGSRVDMVKALFEAIEADGLTQERVVIPEDKVRVHLSPQQTPGVTPGAGPAKMSDDRKEQLLAATPLGQSVLNDKAHMNGAQ